MTLGAAGLADVVEAARQSRIRTVLLGLDGFGGQVWIGPAPTEVALSPDDLLPAGEGRRVRADDALLRSVAETDAELMLFEPDELPDGVAAVLRW